MEAAWANEASCLSSSSSCSISTQFKYDVVLSFRGVDTRNNFTSHLLVALERHGFHTFKDDTKLNRGEYIGDELLKAIEESRLSLVILSENYAASRWCLDELVKIMECRETLQQIVLPIFYNIEPSDVRAQRGSLAEAFSKHEERLKDCSDGRVKKWREALTEVANLSGWDFPKGANGDQGCLIQKAVEEIQYRLDRVHLDVACHEIGESDMASRTGSPLQKQEIPNYHCGLGCSVATGSDDPPPYLIQDLALLQQPRTPAASLYARISQWLTGSPLLRQENPNDHFVLGCSVATGSDDFEAVGTGSESTVECQMAGRNFDTLPPSNQVMASIDTDIVTVKAKYQKYIIKFQLSRPWGKAKLEEQVKKRLKELEAGTYLIQYKDEDGEMILITCDEDLQFYIERSRLQDTITSIVVFLEQK